MAREPTLTVQSSSSTRAGMPCCARSIAAPRPTGPAPPTLTGWRTAAPTSAGGRRNSKTGLTWTLTARVASTSLTFQRLPHLLVALRGPDARVAEARDLVVRARDVERQAVIEDHPVPELGLERIVRLPIARSQVMP